MARSPLFHIFKTLLKKSADNIPINSSRRTFLKAVAASGTTTLFPSPSLRIPILNFRKPVVILGAGAAGLAAAYELKNHSIPFVIYEASSRFGGRVQTKTNFNADGMFGELGAELIDSNHLYLFQLAQQLNVEMERFHTNGLVNQAFFFHNQFLREEDVAEEFEKLVRHIRHDLNRIFNEQHERKIDYTTSSPLARHFDQMDLETYICSITNIDPYVLDMIRVAYVCEFGLETHQQSSLNLLMLMDPEVNIAGDLYGSSDEAWRVRGGNSTLLNRLAQDISTDGETHYQHQLLGLRERHAKIELHLQTPNGHKDVQCDHVICTIPFAVLKQIDGINSLDLSERKRYAIDNFIMGSNTKLISGFTNRFWTNPTSHPNHFFHGQLCTQLNSQVFWDSSRDQSGSQGILTNFLGGDRARVANHNTFSQSLDDFSLLYPEVRLHSDGNSALANWSKNPFSLGSYACPTPGTYTTFFGSLGQPELKNKLIFAGEHTSVSSLGYLNGALESGKLAAQHIIKQLSS